MITRARKAQLPVLAIMALLLAGCGGGGHKVAAGHKRVLTATASGRRMQFSLADASTGPVTTEVPAQPIGSTPSTMPGVTLQLYVLRRVSANAVLAVFALNIQGSVVNAALSGTLVEPLDANWGSNNNVESVSAVSLFDPAGLKEYLPFMANPRDDTTCLCSNIAAGGVFNSAGTFYMAALLAAPPSTVTSLSFVTGLGTIANVPLG